MPEDISKEFKKKISLKEFEVTNTANNGGEYSSKEIATTLQNQLSTLNNHAI